MASILRQVQDEVAERLRGSAQLSACQVLVEDSRDVEFEIKNALGRQGLVLVVTTPKATFAGKLEDLSLAWQLDQLEVDCVENVPVNRGRLSGDFMTAQEAAMAVFDVLCPLEGGDEGRIHPVSYEQGQDQGLLVSRCVLKCLVTGESSGPGPGPGPVSMVFVKLLGEEPPEGVQRKDGWMWPAADGFVMWQDGEAHALGVSMDQISAYVDTRLSDYLPLSGGTLSGDLNAQGIYGDQFTSNGDCQTGGGETYTSFGNNGILMGRSPNILRILWPFDTSLGNNQTFATQEWTNGELSEYPQSNEISATRV